MDTSNNIVGFTASCRQSDPCGHHFVSRINGNALMALWPVSYSDVARSQWVALTATSSQATPRLEVRASANRGMGLFALEPIPAYSRILEDFALLSMSKGEDLPQLWDKYRALAAEDREIFDALSPPDHQVDKESTMIAKLRVRGYSKYQAGAMSRVSSRFQGNAFNIGADGGEWAEGHVLFPNVARINHSCTPNAHSHFRAASGAEYVYALRDIDAGEEIEISYLQVTAPRHVRQNRAKAWSFNCQCPACSGTLGGGYDTDLMNVYVMSIIDAELEKLPDRVERIRNAISTAEADDRPWLRVALPQLYANLAAAVTQAGRVGPEAMDAARTAARWQGRITGPDGPHVYFMARDLPTEDTIER